MENSQQTAAIKPSLPKAWDLFKQSVSFYKENFRFIFEIFIIPFILIIAGSLLLPEQAENTKQIVFDNNLIPFYVLGFILVIVGGILSYISAIAFIKFLIEKEKGLISSTKECYKRGVHLFWPAVWVSILLSFSTFGGFILLIVPGVILYFYLMFSLYVLVDEDKRGLKALVGSWNYVKGYAPNIFLKILFLGLIMFIVFIAYLVLAFLYGFVSAKVGVSADFFANNGIGGVIVKSAGQFIQSLIFGPIIAIYSYFIYNNLKNIKNQGILSSSEELDKKRRNKLMAAAIIGVVAIPLLIIGMFATVFLTLQQAEMKAREAASTVEQFQNDNYSNNNLVD